jgi:hypothetical protein
MIDSTSSIQHIFLLLQSSGLDHGRTCASGLGPEDAAFKLTSTFIAPGAISASTTGRTVVATVDF